MDDIFDEEGDELALISKEYDKLSEAIGKEGMRDGIDAGRSSGTQKGFDAGYADVFPVIETIYYCKGLIQAVYYGPEEVSGSLELDDESNRCLGELLKDLKALENNVLRENQVLQQSTMDSLSEIKTKLKNQIERMGLQIDL